MLWAFFLLRFADGDMIGLLSLPIDEGSRGKSSLSAYTFGRGRSNILRGLQRLREKMISSNDSMQRITFSVFY